MIPEETTEEAAEIPQEDHQAVLREDLTREVSEV